MDASGPTSDDLLLAELRRDEGVRRSAYKCSEGYWTIGVGRLIDASKGGGLSDDEIDYLLANDIEKCKAQLDKALPWWRMLDDVRQRALINLAFNLGIAGLLTFKNTLAAIQAKKWDAASQGLLSSKYASQVGARAQRIAKMIRTGAV